MEQTAAERRQSVARAQAPGPRESAPSDSPAGAIERPPRTSCRPSGAFGFVRNRSRGLAPLATGYRPSGAHPNPAKSRNSA